MARVWWWFPYALLLALLVPLGVVLARDGGWLGVLVSFVIGRSLDEFFVDMRDAGEAIGLNDETPASRDG